MLTFHLLYVLFADMIRLMLVKFVGVGLLVLRGELTTFISKVKTSFSSFPLHNFSSLCSKLFPCFRLVCFSSHPDDYAAISSILIEDLSLFALLLLEMIWVARVEVVIWIVLELNMCCSISFCFNCIQWLLVVMLLSLGKIGSCLFRKAEFKVGIFEVQNSLLVNRLNLTIFMAELGLMFRVELSPICSKTNISLVWSTWPLGIRNWLYIMRSCVWCYELALIISEDQIGVSFLTGLSSSSLGPIISFIIAGCEVS